MGHLTSRPVRVSGRHGNSKQIEIDLSDNFQAWLNHGKVLPNYSLDRFTVLRIGGNISVCPQSRFYCVLVGRAAPATTTQGFNGIFRPKSPW
jgi:hypothetical protein